MASESKKIFPKIEKYLVGNVVDIGCGDEPVKEGVCLLYTSDAADD